MKTYVLHKLNTHASTLQQIQCTSERPSNMWQCCYVSDLIKLNAKYKNQCCKTFDNVAHVVGCLNRPPCKIPDVTQSEKTHGKNKLGITMTPCRDARTRWQIHLRKLNEDVLLTKHKHAH